VHRSSSKFDKAVPPTARPTTPSPIGGRASRRHSDGAPAALGNIIWNGAVSSGIRELQGRGVSYPAACNAAVDAELSEFAKRQKERIE